jgi:pimeloyl-ACP methyl ester carboxylesterase
MKIILLALGWLIAILFGLLALSMVLTRNYIQFVPLLLLVLLVLPPAVALTGDLTGFTLPWWGRALGIAALLAVFMALSSANQPATIYTRPDAEPQFMAIYDARLAEWPVPYESVYLDTSYGQVHVIVSGPEDAPPVLLMHAAAMSSWSWLYNVGALNAHYRTYAIDTIGEVGKSRLDSLDNIPADGRAWSDLVAEVADMLGVERAYVAGASYGGYIATNYALDYPERVERLALLGPMGMTPSTGKTAARITMASMFPLGPVQTNTTRWALGDDPFVLQQYEEWFRLVMTGSFPKESAPKAFTPEQLQGMEVPVLLVLGAKDNLTGSPETVRPLAEHVPGIRIEVLDSGHLIGVEEAEAVNDMLVAFFGES